MIVAREVRIRDATFCISVDRAKVSLDLALFVADRPERGEALARVVEPMLFETCVHKWAGVYDEHGTPFPVTRSSAQTIYAFIEEPDRTVLLSALAESVVEAFGLNVGNG